MPAETHVFYTTQKHLDVDVDWAGDTIKATLHTSAWTPSLSGDEFFSDVTNELATANGYTAGGATLGTKSVTQNGADLTYRSAAATWTAGAGQTITARYMVLRKDTGVAGTSPVLAYVLLDNTPADKTATNAAFTVTPDPTNGWFRVTAS